TPGPALKSETRTYSQSAQGITVTIKTVGADGKEDTVQSTYQLDGKDYPVTGTDYDSLSARKVDSNTATFTLKKAGKAVGTIRRTVAKDGKTLTVKSKGTTAKGEKSEGVAVFDKQSARVGAAAHHSGAVAPAADERRTNDRCGAMLMVLVKIILDSARKRLA